jgi:hypothetical protein
MRLFRYLAPFTMAPLLLVGCHESDPTVGCWTDGRSTTCAVIPHRTSTDAVVYVQVTGDGACTVADTPVECSEVGKSIRAAHPLDNPIVRVCGEPTARYEVLGKVMSALSAEYLMQTGFGCPAHTADRRT